MNVIIDILNETENHWLPDTQTCERWVSSALATACYTEKSGISLKFVSDAESKELNSNYRGKDSSTNVLSFPAQLPEAIAAQLDHRPLGDIVICPSVVETEARDQGKILEAHWAHLLNHGVLHLLGYEHENDEDAQHMESLEIASLKLLGFDNPYAEPAN